MNTIFVTFGANFSDCQTPSGQIPGDESEQEIDFENMSFKTTVDEGDTSVTLSTASGLAR